MNVEIGTEATQFPEKENINRFSLQCYSLVMACSDSFFWLKALSHLHSTVQDMWYTE